MMKFFLHLHKGCSFHHVSSAIILSVIVFTGCNPIEPDYPEVPKSGKLTLINNLDNDTLIVFRIRQTGSTEWKGYNYFNHVTGRLLKPDYQIDFYLPVGRLDLRIESTGNRFWTFNNYLIEESKTYELEVTE